MSSTIPPDSYTPSWLAERQLLPRTGHDKFVITD